MHPIGFCTACGKGCYGSKHDAKAAANQIEGHDGSHTSIYACSTGYWHFGDLPKAVIEGVISRADLAPTRPRTPADRLRYQPTVTAQEVFA